MAGSWSEKPLELLDAEGLDARFWAVQKLRSLAATNAEHGRKIVQAGAIPRLLELLRDGGVPGTREQVAAILRALAANSGPNQDEIIRRGAVPLLVDLLLTSEEGVAEQTAGILMNLAATNHKHRRTLATAGALPGLVRLLTSNLIAVSMTVTNVECSHILSSPERRQTFTGIVQDVVANACPGDVQPDDVVITIMPRVMPRWGTPLGSPIQSPGVFVHGTINVTGDDAPARQRALREAKDEVKRLVGERLTDAGLGDNWRLIDEAGRRGIVEADSFSTSGIVNFSFSVKHVDCQKLTSTPPLFSAFRTYVRDVIVQETGKTICPEDVNLSISTATETVHLKILPSRMADAAAVHKYLERSEGLLTVGADNAIARYLAHMCAPLEEGAPPNPLNEMLTGPMEVTDVTAPVLVEVVYKLSGSHGAQKMAAGALKNIVIGEFQHQDLVVEAGAVPPLINLLQPRLPYGDLFQKLDRDAGGGISYSELAVGLQSLGYSGPVDEIWKRLDRDHSGSILWGEFLERFDEEFEAWQERATQKPPAEEQEEEGEEEEGEEEEEEEELSPLARLIDFLMQRFDSAPLQEQAAGALRTLVTNNEEAVIEVINQGAVPPILDLIKSGTPEVRPQAVGVLKQVAGEWSARIVKQLYAGSLSQEDEFKVVDMLRRAAATGPDQRRTLFCSGCVPPLVHLLESAPADTQERAAATLYQLMWKFPDHEKAVVMEGAVPKLVLLLSAKSSKLQAQAMRAVRLLVSNVALHEQKVVEAGGIPVIVTLLRSEAEPQTHSRAIETLMQLADTPPFRLQVTKAGAVQALQDLLGRLSEDDGGPSDKLRARADEAMELLGLN